MLVHLLFALLCCRSAVAFPPPETDSHSEFSEDLSEGRQSQTQIIPKLKTQQGCPCEKVEDVSTMFKMEFMDMTEIGKTHFFLISRHILGEGGHGRVYHGTEYHPESKRLMRCVAIKVALRGDHHVYNERQLREEAELLRNIWATKPAPKNLIRLEGIYYNHSYANQQQVETAVATELGATDLENFVLAQRPGSNKERERFYLNIMEQITNGLLELHTRGICIWDLQSVNVVVVMKNSSESSSSSTKHHDENFQLKLIDLGNIELIQRHVAHEISDLMIMILHWILEEPNIYGVIERELGSDYNLLFDFCVPVTLDEWPRLTPANEKVHLHRFYQLLAEKFPKAFSVIQFGFDHLTDENIIEKLLTFIREQKKAEREEIGGRVGKRKMAEENEDGRKKGKRNE